MEDSSKRKHGNKYLSDLVESGVVAAGARVRYGKNKDKALKHGRIVDNRIQCDCCHLMFQLNLFEHHAGRKNHRPSENIYLEEDNICLKDCISQMKRKQTKSVYGIRQPRTCNVTKADQDKDTSFICLVCNITGESSTTTTTLCHQCATAYHNDCLGTLLVANTNSNWCCPKCCCRICGEGKDRFENNGFINCQQCQGKFHGNCIGDYEIGKNWFCGENCEKLFSRLDEVTQNPIDIHDDLTWKLLKSSDKQLLKSASDAMHECFESVTDPFTGKDILFEIFDDKKKEKNVKQSSYGGFYISVIEKKIKKNNVVVTTAAIVKVFDEIAEIPLVCTRFKYRKQGLCGIMMDRLERMLVDLGVKNIILPSTPTALHTWTDKFGYSKVEQSEKPLLLRYNFLNFGDTILCKKRIE